jgi:hypothetical protein
VGLVGVSPTGPASNGQPDVEEFKTGFNGKELGAPSEPGNISPATATGVVHVDPNRIPPGNRR